MRRTLCVLLAVGVAAALSVLPVWAAEPGKLIETVAAVVIEIIKTKTGADREVAIRQVLRDDFDLPYMGRSAMGTHWNDASAEQRARFLAAAESSEVHAYSERFGKFAGYAVSIGKVMPRSDNLWIVSSQLTQTSGQPIKLEWEVRDSGLGPRITDVKVEGVSMVMTRRSDFNSYIQSNGGTVEPLVKELEARATR
jgi:phospholipid transport system substrate-binding protein